MDDELHYGRFVGRGESNSTSSSLTAAAAAAPTSTVGSTLSADLSFPSFQDEQTQFCSVLGFIIGLVDPHHPHPERTSRATTQPGPTNWDLFHR